MSSGAIGFALAKTGLPRRPKHLPQVQALAAIGQCRLMGLWDKLFEQFGQSTAQILLTRNDIADRTQYLNAQNTFMELLDMGAIPIVNENDTVAVAEILDKFGDNDTLSAITAGMVGADYLFLMTDVEALYDKNPRTHPDAKPIEIVEDIGKLEADTSSAGSSLGTGGMHTKIVAARLATAAGVTTVITKSDKPGNVVGIVRYLEEQKAVQNFWSPQTAGTRILERENELVSAPTVAKAPLHTRFLPLEKPIGDRRFWLLHGLRPHGTVYIDPGATRALADKAGLLPVGIVNVDGVFSQQECVRLVEVPNRKPPLQSLPSDFTLATASTANEENSGANQTGSSRAEVAATTITSPRKGKSAENGTMVDPAAREVGQALVNYSSTEVKRIAGLKSSEIVGVLGFADSEYVALRENIALLAQGERLSRPVTPSSKKQSELQTNCLSRFRETQMY